MRYEKPIPVRFTAEQITAFDRFAKVSGWSRQQIIRLASQRGLPALRRAFVRRFNRATP